MNAKQEASQWQVGGTIIYNVSGVDVQVESNNMVTVNDDYLGTPYKCIVVERGEPTVIRLLVNYFSGA